MPIKSRVNVANPTPSSSGTPQPSTPASPSIDFAHSPSVMDESSTLDKVGGWLGLGTRAVGGWLSNMGGLAGGAIAGGAEGLAEGFENMSKIPEAIKAIPDVAGHLMDSETRGATAGGFAQGAKVPMARMGLEAALGTIPGSSIVKSGRAAQSAIRSGALSGAGNAARQYTNTGTIDPLQVAGHTAFGAATGGLLGTFGGPRSVDLADGERRVVPHSSPMPAPKTPQQVEAEGMSAHMNSGLPYKTSAGPTVYPPSARNMTDPTTGVPASKEDIASLERLFRGNMGRLDRTEAARQKSQEVLGTVMSKAIENEQKLKQIDTAGLEKGTPRISESVSAELPNGSRRSMSTPYVTPEAETEAEAIAGGALPSTPSISRPIDPSLPSGPAAPPADAESAYAEALAMFGGGKKTPSAPRSPRTPRPKTSAEFDAQANAMAGTPETPFLTRAEEIRQSTHPSFYDEGFEGLEEAAPSIVRPPNPVDTSTMGKAAKDAATGKTPPAGKAPQPTERRMAELVNLFGGRRSTDSPAPPTPVTPEAPPSTSALMNFFKSKVDAMGQANRDIKAAKAAGETVPEAGRSAVGKGLQSEAKAAGLPVGRKAPQYGQPAPPPAGPPTINADEIAAAAKANRPIGQSADELQIKELVDFLTKAGNLKNPTGAVDPMLATQIAGTVGGGLYGAANPDENESRTGSAVKGALGGFALGSMPRLIGAARGMDPNQVRELATKIAQRIPEVQRANYLASGPGLAANAVVGPLGSGITSSIEAMLKGDERGLKALQEIMAIRGGNVKDAYHEAFEHIGRAETRALGEAPTRFDRLTSMPGHALTTGDITVRQALLRAGFSDDEARIMTMTNEPGAVPDPGMLQDAVKATANYTRQGGPIINTMLPFARTPLNMLEQGIPRTPGLGAIYSFFRGDKSLRDAAVEQGLGALAAGGGYVAGANMDPETAKFARRFISNASGRYALPSGLGFAAGQASQQTNPNMAGTIARGVGNAIPLPTTDVIEGWGKTLNDIGNGELNLPSGSYPKILDEFFGADTPSSPTSALPSNLPASGVRSKGRY